MRFAGSVSCRPVRLGFLVPPDDLAILSRVARLSCCLWGGRYNPIIPFFETGGEHWVRDYHPEGGLRVARGYVDFFEPDVLVETTPGMAEKLGWKGEDHSLRMARVVPLDAFYEKDHRGAPTFAAGIDIFEVMQQFYDDEFKYERRHKRPFACVEPSEGNAFFDVVGGRYPDDQDLKYIARAYEDVFDPEKLSPTLATAQKFLREGYAGPIWISRHGLEESLGRGGISGQTFYVFDPTNPGDVIDYWNFRLVDRRVVPISLEWFAEESSFLRERILEVYRPIPGNPSGLNFQTGIQFSTSISDQMVAKLVSAHLGDMPAKSFFSARDPVLWGRVGFGRERRETKILVTGKSIPFDEEASAQGNVKIPAPAPSFLNASGNYTTGRWINLIVPSELVNNDDTALIYPSNIWTSPYPNLSPVGSLRITREGWILFQQYSIGYSSLGLQTGREAIIGWLKTHGIEARPSEEGQVATQLIAAAGSLLACGMFANYETISLLNEMAEGHAKPVRQGVRVSTLAPDRSKHINTIHQHFENRKKLVFGYWDKLEYFLQRSVFRAGLQVQCPTCGYHNWFDLDAISYEPTCSRCLNKFKFSQSPQDLRSVRWFYRVIGPFAAPDYARGGYAVALTLRCLAPFHYSEMTWSTGLVLEPLNCEVDFVAWYRPSRSFRDEGDEPLMVIGEAKSFGRDAIGDEDIRNLKRVAERFPGSLIVISSLRHIAEYSSLELGRLRDLALWGRRSMHHGQPCNPLIVLTAKEVFTSHSIFDDWEDEVGAKVNRSWMDASNLYQVADLTQRKYLGLLGYWEDQMQVRNLAEKRRKLINLIFQRSLTLGA